MWTQICGPEQTRAPGELGSEIGPVLQGYKNPATQAAVVFQLRLILPEATAVGVRLSHASGGRAPQGAWPRARLSNTSSTYPGDGDNLGKLRIIPDRQGVLECPLAQNRRVKPHGPQDGTAAYQVVGGVTAHQAYDG